MQTHYIRIHTTEPALDRTSSPHRKQKRDFADQCSRRPPPSLWIHADPKSRNQKNFIWMKSNARGSKPPSHNIFAWTSLDHWQRGGTASPNKRAHCGLAGHLHPFSSKRKKPVSVHIKRTQKTTFFRERKQTSGYGRGVRA